MNEGWRAWARLVIPVAAALGCAPAAQAGAGAQAQLLNLHFSLLDLAPDDGVAPSFAFVADPDAPNRQRTELTVSAENTATAESDGAIEADFSFIAALGLSRSVTAQQAHAASTATSLTAFAQSLAPGSATAFASAESNVFFADDFGLRLSPMTAITITADAVVAAWDTGAPGAQGFAYEFAQALAFLRIRGADPGDGSGPQDVSSERSAATMVDAAGDSADDSGLLSVSFQNLGDTDLYGYLSARTTVSAFGVTPAVPEPPNWLLALAGIAALLLRSGLRRRGE